MFASKGSSLLYTMYSNSSGIVNQIYTAWHSGNPLPIICWPISFCL